MLSPGGDEPSDTLMNELAILAIFGVSAQAERAAEPRDRGEMPAFSAERQWSKRRTALRALRARRGNRRNRPEGTEATDRLEARHPRRETIRRKVRLIRGATVAAVAGRACR